MFMNDRRNPIFEFFLDDSNDNGNFPNYIKSTNLTRFLLIHKTQFLSFFFKQIKKESNQCVNELNFVTRCAKKF